ncbi:gephyrin-like isoform X2 [Dysidea avara]|uniref:gephyrin-like isoform X2 n=1 Tax=Dysidea avara TaxID=196820 RepID=UPI00332BF67D
MSVTISCGILTVSDRCFAQEAKDESGPNLKRILSEEAKINSSDIITTIVPDDIIRIQGVLVDWCDRKKLSLILTTGGTGFATRDVTPEATKHLIDKEAPGLVVAMISSSLQVTPMAMLSRPVCGIRKSTLIVNLPGSVKGSQECLRCILPALPHALDLLTSNTSAVATTHSTLASGQHKCPHQHKLATASHDRSREDFHKVALRARKSPYPMLPVEEAMRIIMDHTSVLPSIELPLHDALGHVITDDVHATQPLPPFPASIKDGYAVIASDGTGTRTVLDPVTAGDKPDKVTVVSGTCCRITTGAPLPSGADAVVQVEDTELVKSSEDGTIELSVKMLRAVDIGTDIRPIGCDISVGQRVLESGTILGPSELGLLAAVGVNQTKVNSRPVVAVLSTGNELQEPGELPKPGHVYDSNRVLLLSSLKEYGFVAKDMGIAKDSYEFLKESLTSALSQSDIVVTSGGVSMGEKDLLKPILEELGGEILFGRVFMKPGKPTTFVQVPFGGKTKLVFALPGNPVSCAVTFQLFMVPCLRKMSGWKCPHHNKIAVKLGFDISLDQRPEYQRAVLQWKDNGEIPLVATTASIQRREA